MLNAPLMEQAQPTGEGDYIVEPGDSIASIAARAGHLPETIWNDPANAALQQARTDPEVLLPGDRLTVTPRRAKQVKRVTGNRYVFKRALPGCKVTLVLEDEEGSPFASKKYELTLDGKTLEGTTDDAGKIELTIEPTCSAGELKVWLEEPGLPSPWIRELRLGQLHPKDHLVGVQQRLANLGFYKGPLNGLLTAATSEAIAAFCAEQGLDATAGLDQTVVDKLVEIHKI